MLLDQAQQLANEFLDCYGLAARGWTFQFDNAKSRFGQCSYKNKVVSLSRHLTALNDFDQVQDTILHEIAHALVGSGNGHNATWKAMCRRVGANPERCYSDDVARPSHNYEGTCPSCGHVVKRIRLKEAARTIACARCCQGTYNPKYQLVWAKVQRKRKATATVELVGAELPNGLQ